MKTCHISYLTLWLALLAAALDLLLPSRSSLAQVGPNTWFFEIDGDYGDWLEDTRGNDGALYLPALEVNLTDGSRSWGRRQSLCDNWVHTLNAPYTGSRSYRVRCGGAGVQRRTEQMLLRYWYPNSADSYRYFSLAFRLVELPAAPPSLTRGYIAQLHQGDPEPPPFRMQWEYLCPPYSAACGYYLTQGVRSDEGFVEFGPPLGGTRNRKGVAVSPNVWYRMVFRIGILPNPQNPPCPGSGEVSAWIMNNPTGAWAKVGSYTGPLGYRNDSGEDCSFQWKVGIYANNEDAITIDYDNVAYGKRWYNVTKNRLTGYHKTVLDFWFDEGSGNIVRDRSYWWNRGQPNDPLTDYNNDGRIQCVPQRWNNYCVKYVPRWNTYGVKHGGSLHFDGSNYVTVPMDTTDFDFGNYATFACWFRTTNHPTDNKGLIFIDEYSFNWKIRLYMSDTNLLFGVKHPDGTSSTVAYPFAAGTYADGKWHHVVGTFNRFTTDNRRVKLYIDGKRVLQRVGSDLPILRGDNRLVVGKFSSNGFFVGDIDEVLVRNYAMTDAEVAALYAFYLSQ